MTDDENAREAQAALDEQRRRPRDYPRTTAEQMRDEFTPGDNDNDLEHVAE